MRIKQSGQTLIEAIVSLGIVVLIITGVTSVLTNTFGSRNKVFNRKKAVEVAQSAVENLIKQKNEDPLSFWNLSSGFWTANIGVTHTSPNYPGYNYRYTFVRQIGGSCSPTIFNCANSTITVGWAGATETVVFTRFFARY